MRTSHDLRQWKTAFFATRACRNGIADEGVGAHPGRVAAYYADLDKWTAERERLYAALSPADKVTADRITKETT